MSETTEIYQSESVEFLREKAEDPFSFIKKKLNEGVRVIAIGNHHPSRPQQEFYLELLDEIEDIDFLAVEIDIRYKEDVEGWLRSGEIDEAVKKELLSGGNRLLDIVRKATDKGLKIIYADNKRMIRNEFMKQSIVDFLNDNPDSKGLFFCGNLHASMYQSKVASEAGRLLRSELGDSFYTIKQSDYGDAYFDKPPDEDKFGGTLLLEAVRRLNPDKSFVVPNLRFSPFSNIQLYVRGPISKQYDAVIVHPCGKRDPLPKRG